VVYSLPCTAVVQRIEEQVVPWGVVGGPVDVEVEVEQLEMEVVQQQQQQQVFDSPVTVLPLLPDSSTSLPV